MAVAGVPLRSWSAPDRRTDPTVPDIRGGPDTELHYEECSEAVDITAPGTDMGVALYIPSIPFDECRNVSLVATGPGEMGGCLCLLLM